ncbi:MAG: hypothetical protein V4671_07685 [Armatimonadota bacterium]
MRDLSLAMLRDSGLTLDWQTVLVGWQGFSSCLYYSLDLPIEEVRSFAYDSLEYAVDPEYQQALVSLIDAEPGGALQAMLRRYDEELAARSGVTRELAARKWRYAVMWQYIKTFIADAVLRNDLPPEYISDEDCFYVNHVLYANVPDWNEIIRANKIPAIDPVYFRKETFSRCFENLRFWSAEEGNYLSEMGQMAEPFAPLL